MCSTAMDEAIAERDQLEQALRERQEELEHVHRLLDKARNEADQACEQRDQARKERDQARKELEQARQPREKKPVRSRGAAIMDLTDACELVARVSMGELRGGFRLSEEEKRCLAEAKAALSTALEHLYDIR